MIKKENRPLQSERSIFFFYQTLIYLHASAIRFTTKGPS